MLKLFFKIKKNRNNIIFFLLLITGAYIPNEIESIITGLKIYINPFAYFQSRSGGDSNFVSTFFDFGLENSNLEKLAIKSDSTAVKNLFPYWIINCEYRKNGLWKYWKKTQFNFYDLNMIELIFFQIYWEAEMNADISNYLKSISKSITESE